MTKAELAAAWSDYLGECAYRAFELGERCWMGCWRPKDPPSFSPWLTVPEETRVRWRTISSRFQDEMAAMCFVPPGTLVDVVSERPSGSPERGTATVIMSNQVQGPSGVILIQWSDGTREWIDMRLVTRLDAEATGLSDRMAIRQPAATP